jgi:hypothetical protein
MELAMVRVLEETMRGFAIAAGLLTLATGMACSSSSPGPTGASCNPCTDGGSNGGPAPGSGHDSNPDGVPYPAPAAGYGHNPRAGTTAGSIIANYKFLGYPDPLNTAGGLQTISLADYYDPCQKRYKMIHMTVAAVWCNPCNAETVDMVTYAKQLAAKGIIVLQAIDDGGTEGVPATLMDLNYWISVHYNRATTLATPPNISVMLDPDNRNLGAFFNANAIPWNANIDPRTMEVLTSGVGEVLASDIIGDLSLVSSPLDAGAAGLCP